jgi:hypothetical protein
VKKKLLMIVAIVTVVVAATFYPIASSSANQQYEKQFIALINELRTSRGLNILIENPELTSASRVWADSMASAGAISHDPNLANSYPDYELIGENVGMGGSTQSIFVALVNSPGHRRNMLDARFSEVGVGVTVKDDTVYTVHRFLDPVGEVVTTTIVVEIPKPVETPKPIPTTTKWIPPTTTEPVPTTTTSEPVEENTIGKICSPVMPKFLGVPAPHIW